MCIRDRPYVRLCYGELHGEQDSLRIFTGLSEIHLLKNLDLTEVHAMLQTLGYVSYCVPDGTTGVQPRWWGSGIDVHPQAVSAGLPGGKGPMFYSWHYRLPPWAPGLCLEGEDGDFANGPLALVKKRVNVHEEMEKQKVNEDFLGALTKLALDQKAAWAREAEEEAEADARE